MIESKVVQAQSGTNEEYPCIKVHEDGTVALFTEGGTGMCLVTPMGSDTFIGEYCDFWTEEEFTALSSGSAVTLTQK